MGQTVTFTADNFQQEALKASVPVVVDFWASWCGPCKAVAPILDELATQFDGKIKIGKVNVDEHSDLAVQYGVMNIPTMVFLKNGEEVDRMVGAGSKAQLEEKFNKLLS